MATKTKSSKQKHTLIGMFCHSWNEGKKDEPGQLNQQGQVMDVLNESIVVVDIFEWIMGEHNRTLMVPLETFAKDWTLYPDKAAMVRYYTRYNQKLEKSS